MDRPTTELEHLACPAMEIDARRIIVGTNSQAAAEGIRVGEFCWDSFGKCASIPEADRAFYAAHGRPPDGGTQCTFCRADEALQSGSPIVEILDLGGTKLETHWRPTGKGTYLHYAIALALG